MARREKWIAWKMKEDKKKIYGKEGGVGGGGRREEEEEVRRGKKEGETAAGAWRLVAPEKKPSPAVTPAPFPL